MSLWNKVKKWGIIEAMEYLSWMVVAYLLGILLFTFFTGAPFLLMGGMIGGLLIVFMGRRNLGAVWIGWIIFCFFLGAGNISLRIRLASHPTLEHPLYQVHIVAQVEESQALFDKQILTLTDIRWENPDLKMPQKIKVHFKETKPLIRVGDRIVATVSVYPLDAKFSPAYTYQLWFNKIGATGIVNNLKEVSVNSKSHTLFELRHFINQHLFNSLPFSQAEIMAPLITGEQKLVSRETYQIYRRAGIAHVLSISGFHMALLAGFLFFVIRRFCALFPRIVLYYNTKKIAAVIALFGTFLYLGLSGFQVPALRAFMMIALVLMGILIERSVLSMRSLVLVCFSLLLIFPQMLFSIGFQLSFLAVAVLIAICHFIQNQPWGRIKKAIVGFLLLNIGVSFALMPFIAYHFHLFNLYGILGNMILSSTFSLFIMPLLFVGALLIPFGLDVPIFKLAGFGLDIVRLIAKRLAHFSYAEIRVEYFSFLALGMFSFGIIIICLMKTPLRWLGSLLIIAGIILGIWT